MASAIKNSATSLLHLLHPTQAIHKSGDSAWERIKSVQYGHNPLVRIAYKAFLPATLLLPIIGGMVAHKLTYDKSITWQKKKVTDDASRLDKFGAKTHDHGLNNIRKISYVAFGALPIIGGAMVIAMNAKALKDLEKQNSKNVETSKVATDEVKTKEGEDQQPENTKEVDNSETGKTEGEDQQPEIEEDKSKTEGEGQQPENTGNKGKSEKKGKKPTKLTKKQQKAADTKAANEKITPAPQNPSEQQQKGK